MTLPEDRPRGDAPRRSGPDRGDRRPPTGRDGRDSRDGRDARDGRGDRRTGGPARVYAKPDAVDAARRAAYNAIAAVHRDDAYANLALPSILRDAGLHGRDAAFATELTYGTLRAGGTIDEIIAIAADRGVDRIDPPARDALRLGVYQLLYTRVPAHAAVSATVDLVRSVGSEGASGFANAVMRQIAAKDLDAWLTTIAPDRETDRIGYLAVTQHHPQWIVRAFADALGGDLDETEQLLIEDNERPIVHLCARPGRIDAIDLADDVGGTPARSPRSPSTCPAAPRATWPPSCTPTRTCRTRGRSWWRTRWPRRRSTGRTSAGSTSVPARVARRACWARSRHSGVRT